MTTSKQVRMRRGTTTDHNSFTGAVGEVTVDTTLNTLRVHDNATVGGFPLALQDLSNVPTNGAFMQMIENLIAQGGGGSTVTATVGSTLTGYASPGSSYIPANGATLSKTTYAALYGVLGDTYSLAGVGAAPSTPAAVAATPAAGTGYNLPLPVSVQNGDSVVGSNGNMVTIAQNGGSTTGHSFITVTPAGQVSVFNLGANNTVGKIFFFAGKFMSVVAGKTWSSTDGITWTSTTNNLASSAWIGVVNGKLTVAQGATGAWNFATSTDGITFTVLAVSAVITGSVANVVYSSRLGLYLVGNNTMLIYSSPDLVTWTARQSTSNANGSNPVFCENSSILVCANGSSGTNAILIYSSTDGITWTSRTANASGFFQTAIWNPASAKFYVGCQSGVMTASSDGMTWAAITNTTIGVPANNYFTKMINTPNGMLLLGSVIGTSAIANVAYTTNGTTWTVGGTKVASMAFNGMQYDPTNNILYMMGDINATSGVANIYTSPDMGTTFRAIYTGVGSTVTYSNRKSNAIATVGGVVKQVYLGTMNPGNGYQIPLYSENQLQTSQILSLTLARPNGVIYRNGNFIMFNNTGIVGKSTDGKTWTTSQSIPSTESIAAIEWNGTKYIAVGISGNVYISTDLVTWTASGTILVPTTGLTWNILWTGTRWVVCNGITLGIATSTDGSTWTTTVTSSAILNMAYGNNRLVLMAANATFSTGDYNNYYYSSTSIGIKANTTIAFGNGVFVIGGGDQSATPTGNIVFNTSYDGLSWNVETIPTVVISGVTIGYGGVKKIVFGDNFFAAQCSYLVGTSVTGQAIFTSHDGTRWSLAGATPAAASADDIASMPTVGYVATSVNTTLTVELTDPTLFRVPTIPPDNQYSGNYYIKFQ